MPEIPLAAGLQGRPRVGMPALRLTNAYSEKSAGGPSSTIRTSRPGFPLLYTLGNGPVFRAYQVPGLFSLSAPFFVSGANLYQGSSLIGPVAYGQFPRMGAANSQLAIVSGGGLWTYNGTTLTQQTTFNDGVSRLPSFGGMAVLYNYFLYWIAGSQEFFFSAVGVPGNISAANFSSAQVNPDQIVEMAVLGEELYIFKARSVEIWDYTGVFTAPFAESQGRTYARGCASQNSVVQLDNSLFWVGDDYSVYRTSTVPEKVSTPYIDDRLKNAGASGIAQLTAFTVGIEGHVFYVINLPVTNESYAYDASTGQWSRWGSQNTSLGSPGLFIGGCAAGQGDQTVVGDAASGNVYSMSATSNQDNGKTVSVIVSGALWIAGGSKRINNVSLQCIRGGASPGATNPDPIVSMRYSDDGGRTWTSWAYALLGPSGAYVYKAIWWNLGTIFQPGRLFEWRVNDPVNFTVQSATYNEARP